MSRHEELWLKLCRLEEVIDLVKRQIVGKEFPLFPMGDAPQAGSSAEASDGELSDWSREDITTDGAQSRLPRIRYTRPHTASQSHAYILAQRSSERMHSHMVPSLFAASQAPIREPVES